SAKGTFRLFQFLPGSALQGGLELIAAEVDLGEAGRPIDFLQAGIALQFLHRLFDAAIVEGAELLFDWGRDEIDRVFSDEKAEKKSDAEPAERAPKVPS